MIFSSLAPRILIVDDHPDLRLLVREALDDGASGYVIQEAANAQEALAVLADFHPAVVILDLMLPGGSDGYEICRLIKAAPSKTLVFVIMLTARGQKADEERGKAAGADLYFIKPFSPLELAAAVREITAIRAPAKP